MKFMIQLFSFSSEGFPLKLEPIVNLNAGTYEHESCRLRIFIQQQTSLKSINRIRH